YRRAGQTVAGAIHDHGVGGAGCLCDLPRDFGPLLPGDVAAGDLDACLLEERRVDERSGDGQLGHEAGDGRTAGWAHPIEERPEVGLPVVGVIKVWAQVEEVLREPA